MEKGHDREDGVVVENEKAPEETGAEGTAGVVDPVARAREALELLADEIDESTTMSRSEQWVLRGRLEQIARDLIAHTDALAREARDWRLAAGAEADMVKEQAAELERLRGLQGNAASLEARLRHLATNLSPQSGETLVDAADALAAARAEVERYEDFSNEVIANAGDEWDDDEAQETIAIRYVRWLEAEVERLKKGLLVEREYYE